MKLVFCLPFCPSIHSSWTLRFRRLRRVHRPIRRHRASSTAAAVPLRRTTPSTPARFLPPTVSFALLWMIEIGSIWWLAASSEAPWIQTSGPSHSNPSFFSCDSWWYWWRRWHRVANCWNRCEICLGGELKCLIELLRLMLFCAPFEDLAWLIFVLCCWYRSRDFSSAPSVFRRRRWKWGSISWFEANLGALRIKNGFLAVEIVDSVAIFGDNSDRLDIVCPALFFSSIEVWNRVGFGIGSEFGVASIVVLCIFWRFCSIDICLSSLIYGWGCFAIFPGHLHHFPTLKLEMGIDFVVCSRVLWIKDRFFCPWKRWFGCDFWW